jgi:tryptophan 7-halogenase
MRDINSIVVLGGGTAGLITALTVSEKLTSSNITIIASDDIGIIGVGEGSTEHWLNWIQYVNIPFEDVYREAGATVKIGIYFKDWCGPGHRYVHSIDQFDRIERFNRLDRYNFNVLRLPFDKNNANYQTNPGFEKLFGDLNVPVFNRHLNITNQYHFDTFKLNTYLRKVCEERGIRIVNKVVSDVSINDGDGFITSLKFNDDSIMEGDFFVDCSGFKRVIASKLDNKWVSYQDYLPMNHAIAFPTAHTSDSYEAYTTATALKAGWSWRIPTQERYGNGYVFCDDYINSEEALNEINESLGEDVQSPARDIKFEAGRVENFWKKNCLCVGLAGSFAEPLEAQSIGFSIQQAFGLIDFLQSWRYSPDLIEKQYNSTYNNMFENIVSFLQAHYFVHRDDTPFWKEKPFKLTKFNEEMKEVFKAGHVESIFFPDNNLMFKAQHWYQLLNGIGYFDRSKLTSIVDQHNIHYLQSIENDVREYYNTISKIYTLKHSDFIKMIVSLNESEVKLP